MEEREQVVPLGILAAYCACFFAVWTLWTLWLRPLCLQRLPLWPGVFFSESVKLLLWTLPAWLLCRRYAQALVAPRWFSQRFDPKPLALWTALMVAYTLLVSALRSGLQPHEGFALPSLVSAVLLVGITEEAVFRGFLLNALAKRWPERSALIVSSLLFVLIHVPSWSQKGVFASPWNAISSCASIFVLGYLFGFRFLRDRNLLSPILLHMCWNLPAAIFFG